MKRFVAACAEVLALTAASQASAAAYAQIATISTDEHHTSQEPSSPSRYSHELGSGAGVSIPASGGSAGRAASSSPTAARSRAREP